LCRALTSGHQSDGAEAGIKARARRDLLEEAIRSRPWWLRRRRRRRSHGDRIAKATDEEEAVGGTRPNVVDSSLRGRRLQEGVDILRRTPWVLLQDQGRRTCHVRASHRGTAEKHGTGIRVCAAGGDQTAGGEDVHALANVAEAGALVIEARLADGAHSDGCRYPGRRVTASIGHGGVSFVACRHDHCYPQAGGSVDGAVHGAQRAPAAQTRADDRRSLAPCSNEVDGHDEEREAAAAIVTKDLHGVESGLLGDAEPLAADGACAMRSVPIDVRCASGVIGFALDDAVAQDLRRRDGPAFKVFVGGPDACVHDVDMHPSSGERLAVIDLVQAGPAVDSVQAPYSGIQLLSR